jgi:hypothetical protein
MNIYELHAETERKERRLKKSLERAIKKEQQRLIERANKKGLYENFGQTEVGKLEGIYINTSNNSDTMHEMLHLIQEFNDWCMEYTG